MRPPRSGGVQRDSPGLLQEAGLKEGDYIVSVSGQPCRWWKHAEVVAQLQGVGDGGVSLQVATPLPATELPISVSPGPWEGVPNSLSHSGPGLWPGPKYPRML